MTAQLPGAAVATIELPTPGPLRTFSTSSLATSMTQRPSTGDAGTSTCSWTSSGSVSVVEVVVTVDVVVVAMVVVGPVRTGSSVGKFLEPAAASVSPVRLMSASSASRMAPTPIATPMRIRGRGRGRVNRGRSLLCSAGCQAWATASTSWSDASWVARRSSRSAVTSRSRLPSRPAGTRTRQPCTRSSERRGERSYFDTTVRVVDTLPIRSSIAPDSAITPSSSAKARSSLCGRVGWISVTVCCLRCVSDPQPHDIARGAF